MSLDLAFGLTDEPSSSWQLGPYQVLAVLGAGMHGVVYSAVNVSSGQRVAVKIAQDAASSRVLRSELAILQTLQAEEHPGIVKVYESGEHEARFWFAMEEVPGGSLADLHRQLWRNGRVSGMPEVAGGELTRVLQVIRSLAAVLVHLQRVGIVHGDLSPDNILLRNGQQAVVADWGTVSGADVTGLSTHHGIDLATPGYCAPERLLGQGWDSRADIYSLGCIWYQLLTGVPVFSAADAEGLHRQHVHVAPTAPSRLVESCTPDLVALILSTLEKTPRRRLADPRELVARIDSMLGDTPTERHDVCTTFYPALVGRAAALTSICNALRGSCRAVVVQGEAGSGKSRILLEARHTLVASGVQAFSINLSPTSEHPLRPFAQVVSNAAEKMRGTHGQDAQAELLDDLELYLHSDDWRRSTTSDDLTRHRYFGAVVTALEIVSGSVRTCWVFDDVDQSDYLCQDFLRWFAAQPEPSNLAFLVSTNQGWYPNANAPRAEGVHTVTLDALTWRETAELCGEILAVADVHSELIDPVFRATKGNPFGVERLLRNAARVNALERRGPLATLGANANLHALSTTLDQVGSLGPSGDRTLQAAAIVGRSFDAGDVEEFLGRSLGEPPTAVRESLELMAARGLVFRVGPENYRFTHEITRASVEASLHESESARLHEARARQLEASKVAILPLAQIGLHWARAKNAQRAIPYLRRAAKMLSSRAAIVDAIELAQQAHQLSEHQGPDQPLHARVSLELIRLYAKAGRHQDVLRVASTALATAARPNLTHARIHRCASVSSRIISDYPNAEGHVQKGLTLTSAPARAKVAWTREWLELELSRSKLLYVQGRVDDSRVLLDRVMPIARRQGTAPLRAEFYMAASNAILLGRRYAFSKKALFYQRRALEAYQRHGGAPASVAMALFDVAFVLLLGEPDGYIEALDLLSQAEALATSSKDAVMEARVSTYQAIALRRMRRTAECERAASLATERARACGLRGYVGAAHACHAWVALMRDQAEQVFTRVANARENWWRAERTIQSRQAEYPFQWLANLPLLAVQLSEGTANEVGETIDELLHPRQARLSEPLQVRLLRLRRAGVTTDADFREVDACLRLANELRYL